MVKDWNNKHVLNIRYIRIFYLASIGIVQLLAKEHIVQFNSLQGMLVFISSANR